MAKVLVAVGTQKGAFFFWSDEEREGWRVEGPLLKGWEVSDIQLDARREPTLWAAVGHFVYGSTLQVSKDLGESWGQIEHGPSYDEAAGHTLERIWSVAPGRPDEPDTLYAGVAEAGLFVSEDGGGTWTGVEGLNEHETRAEWSPGAGGLCCHSIVVDATNSRRMFVGISAVGTFRTDDGGTSWQVKNEGIPVVAPPEGDVEVGSCVHRLVQAHDDPDLLYQQNHRGVFRSRDAGDHWERIEEGLPSSFGFPMVIHPRDSRTLWVMPMESDEYRFFENGKLAVYRTRDGGDSWQALTDGLPANSYVGVLRQAMAVDDLNDPAVYFGTTGGQVFIGKSGGDQWQALPCQLPRVLCVSAMTVE